ncbi:inositol-tetrakisphosphate 1-kinase [Phycomyces blakesleeanus]|uniref:inositol-1,3,4-trisphosphate 5/6-kinase n=1 Tax=Phycomyces blakesleeanus TaxID=4837 RepID=A0ABR3B926_PHYBL
MFIKRFCESHPKVIIMDTWENVEKVINRSKLHWLLEKSIEFKPPQNKGQLFSVPKSISLESFDMRSEALNMKFPIICKRSKACASVSSHQMTIIPTLNAMSKVTGYGKNEQVILQEFIQHGGILIKVYVLDKHVYPALRPSFKDLNQNCDVFHFDSQILPKSFHSSSKLLNGLDKVMSISNEDVEKRIYETLDYDRLEKIADVLRHQIGLTFFGFDVILEAKTNNHYLVDVNYFPSFSNVPKFHEIFVSILLQKLNNP